MQAQSSNHSKSCRMLEATLPFLFPPREATLPKETNVIFWHCYRLATDTIGTASMRPYVNPASS